MTRINISFLITLGLLGTAVASKYFHLLAKHHHKTVATNASKIHSLTNLSTRATPLASKPTRNRPKPFPHLQPARPRSHRLPNPKWHRQRSAHHHRILAQLRAERRRLAHPHRNRRFHRAQRRQVHRDRHRRHPAHRWLPAHKGRPGCARRWRESQRG